MPKSKKLRVLLASSEAVPFAKTGGLGDVAGTLPYALAKAGAKVSVVLPWYAAIPADLLRDAQEVARFDVDMPAGLKPCKVGAVRRDDVTFFLMGNAGYFDRDAGLYGYCDDGERFAFFSRAVCQAVATLPEFSCDVIHCNDWQTALIPVYLRELHGNDRRCRRIRTVFTVHNAMFQGQGPDFMLQDVCGLEDYPVAAISCTMDDGSVNLMKGALTYADQVTTVSPTYAQELQRHPYGEGLESLFWRRRKNLRGVLNGIDQDIWNPATDQFIPAPFTAKDRSGKAVCKAELQRELGLAVDAERPLVAMVARLTDQKGVGMVCQVVPRLMERGVQLVILGTGDAAYEEQLAHLAEAYPEKMACALRFDNALSHRMYAGADLFLMPSLFEPCGLSQMISMRYGTLPVVRETGGLKDSVDPYNRYTGVGTGFSFANADAWEMADILLAACEVFWCNKAAWSQLQDQSMAADFSWERAAARYLEIYK